LCFYCTARAEARRHTDDVLPGQSGRIVVAGGSDDIRAGADRRRNLFIGYCIGGCFAGKLLERAPDRVVGAVFCQTVGKRPEDPTVMYRHNSTNWVPGFRERRPDVSSEVIEKYLNDLYEPEFLHSVSRDFVKNCQTPMLVLPDDTDSHPLQTSIDVASLAPNAEITVFPWRDPPELKARTIDRVRKFFRENVPAA
jgi:pimeloyl-ACP methyl ester carboxylesterase